MKKMISMLLALILLLTAAVIPVGGVAEATVTRFTKEDTDLYELLKMEEIGQMNVCDIFYMYNYLKLDNDAGTVEEVTDDDIKTQFTDPTMIWDAGNGKLYLAGSSAPDCFNTYITAAWDVTEKSPQCVANLLSVCLNWDDLTALCKEGQAITLIVSFSEDSLFYVSNQEEAAALADMIQEAIMGDSTETVPAE